MKTLNTIGLIALTGLIISCNNTQTKEGVTTNKEIVIENPTNKIGLSKDIEYIFLNPARGDKAPMAGAIYGNIREDVPTGYIGKFKNGFSSPPHIHNVTYRAIVMNGAIHNDDPKAEKMWMPTGSFWTQPKGEAHITSAKGENTMAYIEIDNGPYLVKPVSQAFDSGESPINIDIDNMMWLDDTQVRWIAEGSTAKVAFLWKNKDNIRGFLVKFPAGFKGTIYTKGKVFYGIIIKGNIAYTMPNADKATDLDQGSHFESTGNSLHDISTTEESLIYIRTSDAFKIAR